MPQAVTHILIPILVISIFRDLYLKNKDKKHFPLHYVLLAGIGGILPDIDILAFWAIQKFGFSLKQIHGPYTHVIWIPLIFLFLYLALININMNARICNIGKHKLKLNIIFLMLGIGWTIHIILDAIFQGGYLIFYPLFDFKVGLNLVYVLPLELRNLFMATLDGILLVTWVIYLELKHKISNFI